MRYFDLHCDTLSRCTETGVSLLAPEGQLSLPAGHDFSAWAQCFAAFIPDTLRGEEAFRYFEKLSDVLIREAAQHPEKTNTVPHRGGHPKSRKEGASVRPSSRWKAARRWAGRSPMWMTC